ncbi:hypothetical protein [Haloarchaeobius baliensis]|uniref:hypothetical protein n=1 Tax=Haloarchaeobius baliensis TaxID=1670458 RepID=UPI003F885245
MVTIHMPSLDSLEDRSSALFLVAGVLLVVYATFNGVHASTGAVYESVENVFGPAGFALGFLGLLGLSRPLRDRSPRVVRVGAVCAVAGAVAFTVFAVANLGEIAGVVPREPPAWAVVFLALAVVGMIPGYLSVALVTLRTDEYPRSVGLCLLAPAAIFGTMFTGSMLGSSPQWALFLISAGQALAHLSIGYALWRSRLRTEVGTPATDVSVS